MLVAFTIHKPNSLMHRAQGTFPQKDDLREDSLCSTDVFGYRPSPYNGQILSTYPNPTFLVVKLPNKGTTFRVLPMRPHTHLPGRFRSYITTAHQLTYDSHPLFRAVGLRRFWTYEKRFTPHHPLGQFRLVGSNNRFTTIRDPMIHHFTALKNLTIPSTARSTI